MGKVNFLPRTQRPRATFPRSSRGRRTEARPGQQGPQGSGDPNMTGRVVHKLFASHKEAALRALLTQVARGCGELDPSPPQEVPEQRASGAEHAPPLTTRPPRPARPIPGAAGDLAPGRWNRPGVTAGRPAHFRRPAGRGSCATYSLLGGISHGVGEEAKLPRGPSQTSASEFPPCASAASNVRARPLFSGLTFRGLRRGNSLFLPDLSRACPKPSL